MIAETPVFSISALPLDCVVLSKTLHNYNAGGYVSFEGWVRNNSEGHSVVALEYEVFHALAESEGQLIIEEAIAKFSIIAARAVHREGKLDLGDCAIWIGATASHRSEAFSACRYIIDEIKHRLPIWKKEYYNGRTPQWVNCQHDANLNIMQDNDAVTSPQNVASDNLNIFIRPHDTAEALRRQFIFVDVRETWELEMQPLPSALHLPTSDLDAAELEPLKDMPLLLICAKGVRSLAAAEFLRKQGWRYAYSLAGGIEMLPMPAEIKVM